MSPLAWRVLAVARSVHAFSARLAARASMAADAASSFSVTLFGFFVGASPCALAGLAAKNGWNRRPRITKHPGLTASGGGPAAAVANAC